MACEFDGVNRVPKKRKDGTVKYYYYHRATKVRLNGEPGSPEFIRSYEDAEAALSGHHCADTFNGLVRIYTGSVEFERKLAIGTQREYRRMLTKAEPKFGTVPIAFLDDPRIRMKFLKWRDVVAKDSGAREADNRLSAISAMLTWAVGRGHIQNNYIKGFTRLYHSDRSDIIWRKEHMQAFLKAAPVELQRAFIIALHTGLREADILSLRWSAYDGEHIRLVPGKGTRQGRRGKSITIKCSTRLRMELDAIERTSEFVLTTKTGRPFTKRYFTKKWEEVTKAAGLDIVSIPGRDEPVSLHFHDLRGTMVTLLAISGSTVPMIASVTAHSLKTVTSILERYIARDPALSNNAIDRFEIAPDIAFVHGLQTGCKPANREPGFEPETSTI